MQIEWERVEPTKSQTIGSYRTLVTKHFMLPDGTLHEYVTKEKEGSQCIATVALTPEGKVIVARQFRPGPEKTMYELPGGGVDPGEDLEAAAHRELLEETGYQAGTMQFLGVVYKDAYTNTKWNYFLAADCIADPNGPQPDEREFIEIVLISIEQLLTNARTTQMTDTEGVFLAYDQLQDIQKRLALSS